MNKETQPLRENVSSLSESKQQKTPFPDKSIIQANNPDQPTFRPTFRSDPNLQEEKDATNVRKLFQALNGQSDQSPSHQPPEERLNQQGKNDMRKEL